MVQNKWASSEMVIASLCRSFLGANPFPPSNFTLRHKRVLNPFILGDCSSESQSPRFKPQHPIGSPQHQQDS